MVPLSTWFCLFCFFSYNFSCNPRAGDKWTGQRETCSAESTELSLDGVHELFFGSIEQNDGLRAGRAGAAAKRPADSVEGKRSGNIFRRCFHFPPFPQQYDNSVASIPFTVSIRLMSPRFDAFKVHLFCDSPEKSNQWGSTCVYLRLFVRRGDIFQQNLCCQKAPRGGLRKRGERMCFKFPELL